MTIELITSLSINSLFMLLFSGIYLKFKSINDILIIVDSLDYVQFTAYIFVASIIYSIMILARYFVFPRLTSFEQHLVLREHATKYANIFVKIF